MADSLTATGSILAGVRPTLDGNGDITALTVDVALSYEDINGDPAASRTVSIDAWSLLDATQKANMQDIQSTLMAYIVATYFA